MTRRKVEKQLKQYAAECRSIAPQDRESRIAQLLQLQSGLCTRGTFGDFIVEQISFLGRYCLLWQMVWLAIFCSLIRYGIPHYFDIRDSNSALTVISIMPPILVLLTVEEITKVYQRSMLEIEYATKYSLRNVIVVRMLVLCSFHFLILAISIIALQIDLDSDMGRLLVYGFTPMILETGVLMKLMQRFEGEQLRSMSVGTYVLTVILVIVGDTRYFGWYRAGSFRWWCVACFVGVVFGILQFIRLSRKLKHFDQIMGE